jgi:DHA1 family bicyclomycin/chloramphenicol resistance-like MFS transporter
MRFPRWLPILLGFLQAVGPMSIDMYLPAFPAIERNFHAAPGSAQVTLATWILGLSVGQLALGALADRFGRRAPLLMGTAVYALAGGVALRGGDRGFGQHDRAARHGARRGRRA